MNAITRRPFLLLSLFIAGAALLQAIVGANSPPAEADGKLPAGMICTACGPIYAADAPQIIVPQPVAAPSARP